MIFPNDELHIMLKRINLEIGVFLIIDEIVF